MKAIIEVFEFDELSPEVQKQVLVRYRKNCLESADWSRHFKPLRDLAASFGVRDVVVLAPDPEGEGEVYIFGVVERDKVGARVFQDGNLGSGLSIFYQDSMGNMTVVNDVSADQSLEVDNAMQEILANLATTANSMWRNAYAEESSAKNLEEFFGGMGAKFTRDGTWIQISDDNFERVH